MFERARKPIASFPPVQRAALEPAAAPPAPAGALPRQSFADLAVHPPRADRDGLPDRLRQGVEALSGVSLDGVKVYYNSPRPAEVAARAFARGREIHLGPGQERHLPHETWHLVQQAEGRVRPRLEVPGGVQVNDDAALEREASVMGSRAVHANPQAATRPVAGGARAACGGAGPPVMQPYWVIGPDGKPMWIEGMPPKDLLDTGQKKKGGPVFAAPDTVKALKDKEENAKKEKEEKLEKSFADRAIGIRSRSAFSRKESRRLQGLPKMVTREDRNPRNVTNSRGLGKAHVIDEGLETAGKANISATEQQDAESRKKGSGNRISSKAPLASGKEDKSQDYGGETIGIKAQKLERARLRGKADAQHVQVHTTDEIASEIDKGPEKSETGKTRDQLKAYARRDREYHHSVGFFSPSDPRHYIPNRFLRIGDVEVHDSDSDEDSGPEDEQKVPQNSGLKPLVTKKQSSSYGPGYGPRSSSSYGPGYDPGYGSGSGSSYGPGYDPGYGSGSSSSYGPGYDPGYGSGSGSRQGPGYGPGGRGSSSSHGPGYGPSYFPSSSHGPGYGPGFGPSPIPILGPSSSSSTSLKPPLSLGPSPSLISSPNLISTPSLEPSPSLISSPSLKPSQSSSPKPTRSLKPSPMPSQTSSPNPKPNLVPTLSPSPSSSSTARSNARGGYRPGKRFEDKGRRFPTERKERDEADDRGTG